ncbi:DUF1203 domain-containing protein [Octadecabacter sp. CECT 8868]|uniref:DUF1203 domain-containing protein n=1 Tax=Octadecabacter algicola TaxID=2909342 RepID=UPI001F3E4F44|nr:DUF1203 domain-containing protein [Octadecabacter algicola]MCF2904877.1 DUF1203 domain-containing protein [Octadecabacter algicola]
MRYSGLTTKEAKRLRAGGGDAFGNSAERAISSGVGTPCRHCLKIVPKGDPFLIASHKPFESTQPYSEIGPIFLCANPCMAPSGVDAEVLTASPQYLLKAYSSDERIIYGTGAVTPAQDLEDYAMTLFERDDVAFVDVRSAVNNCWLARITGS